MFNQEDMFGDFDLMRRPRMRGKLGQMPPLTGETPPTHESPPIIAQDDVQHGREERPSGPSMSHGSPADAQNPSWRQRISGRLGQIGSMMPEQEEESYLEPMQMQPQQGQMFAPQQQQPNWWMAPPKRRMY